jgi:hypothetical protein
VVNKVLIVGGKNGGGIVVVVVHMVKLATIAGDNLKQK